VIVSQQLVVLLQCAQLSLQLCNLLAETGPLRGHVSTACMSYGVASLPSLCAPLSAHVVFFTVIFTVIVWWERPLYERFHFRPENSGLKWNLPLEGLLCLNALSRYFWGGCLLLCIAGCCLGGLVDTSISPLPALPDSAHSLAA
jgi:hypothetical protein